MAVMVSCGLAVGPHGGTSSRNNLQAMFLHEPSRVCMAFLLPLVEAAVALAAVKQPLADMCAGSTEQVVHCVDAAPAQ